MKQLDQKTLKDILDYNSDTGIFSWKIDPISGPKRQGNIAGTITKKGYRRILINRQPYMAHRLAFLYMTGNWPTTDMDKDNNSWKNIREATGSQNCANQIRRKNNKSGFKGVHWNKQAGRWQASISVSRKQIYLGLYDDPEDAHKVYVDQMTKLQPEFGRY
jgi:hypothetical protein